ncbi:hypothetical protein ACHAWF_008316 [Thalassiosira exigua]
MGPGLRRKLVAALLVLAAASRSFKSDLHATSHVGESAPQRTAAAKNGTERAAPATLRGSAVIQLKGELGNNLLMLAYYFALRSVAREELGLELTLHVRKQHHRKADSAAEHARCLKSFSDVDFDECNWFLEGRGAECEGRQLRQIATLKDFARIAENETIAGLVDSLDLTGVETLDEIRALLRDYVALLRDESILALYQGGGVGWTRDEPYPFLYGLSTTDLWPIYSLVHEVYGRGLPEYFALDVERDECCAALPEEDEQVFHYRSFVRDLPRMHMSWGGAELAPPVAAKFLSASLPPGTTIALVSGRAAEERTLAYRDAFRNRSFAVRTIAGQTGIQDFCFLAHARAGLWGMERSSYVTWASLINTDLKNATLYGAMYPARSKDKKFVSIRTPNEELARIVHRPVLNLSNDDVW